MKRERITEKELETLRRICRGGIHYAVIAEEMGVEATVVWRWMNGSRYPSYLATDRIRRFIKKHTILDGEGK